MGCLLKITKNSMDGIQPSGHKSLLFDKLKSNYGKYNAAKIYEFAHSSKFVKFFGDWVSYNKLLGNFHSSRVREEALNKTIKVTNDPKLHKILKDHGIKYVVNGTSDVDLSHFDTKKTIEFLFTNSDTISFTEGITTFNTRESLVNREPPLELLIKKYQEQLPEAETAERRISPPKFEHRILVSSILDVTDMTGDRIVAIENNMKELKIPSSILGTIFSSHFNHIMNNDSIHTPTYETLFNIIYTKDEQKKHLKSVTRFTPPKTINKLINDLRKQNESLIHPLTLSNEDLRRTILIKLFATTNDEIFKLSKNHNQVKQKGLLNREGHSVHARPSQDHKVTLSNISMRPLFSISDNTVWKKPLEGEDGTYTIINDDRNNLLLHFAAMYNEKIEEGDFKNITNGEKVFKKIITDYLLAIKDNKDMENLYGYLTNVDPISGRISIDEQVLETMWFNTIRTFKEVYGENIDSDVDISLTDTISKFEEDEFDEKEEFSPDKEATTEQGFEFVAKDVKLFMELTMYDNEEAGMRTPINSNEVFRLLQIRMAKRHFSEGISFDEIFADVAEDNPQVNALHERFQRFFKYNPNIRESFVKELKRVIVHHKTVLFDAENQKTNIVNSNSNNYTSILLNEWKTNFNLNLSEQLSRKAQSKRLARNIKRIATKLNTYATKAMNDAEIDEQVEILLNDNKFSIENSTGIKLEPAFIRFSLLAIQKNANHPISSENEAFFNRHASLIMIKDKNAIVNPDIFNRMADIIHNEKLSAKDKRNLNILNPYVKDSTNNDVVSRIKKLATSNAMFSETMKKSSFKDAAGKSKSNTAQASFLTSRALSLQSAQLRAIINSGEHLKLKTAVKGNTLLSHGEEIDKLIFDDMHIQAGGNIAQSIVGETPDAKRIRSQSESMNPGADYRDTKGKDYELVRYTYFTDPTFSKKITVNGKDETVRFGAYVPVILETSNTLPAVTLPVGKSSVSSKDGLAKTLNNESFTKIVDGKSAFSDIALDTVMDMYHTKQEFIKDESKYIMKGVYELGLFLKNKKDLGNDEVDSKHTLANGYHAKYKLNEKGEPTITLGRYKDSFQFSAIIGKDGTHPELRAAHNDAMQKLEDEMNKILRATVGGETYTTEFLDRIVDNHDFQDKSKEELDVLRGVINEYLDAVYQQHVANLISDGIIKKGKNDKLENILLPVNNNPALFKTSYNSSIDHLTRDFFINDYIYSTEYIRLMYGDLSAFVNSTDLVKRDKISNSHGNNASDNPRIKVSSYAEALGYHPTLGDTRHDSRGEIEIADAQTYGNMNLFTDTLRSEGRYNKGVQNIIQKVRLGIPITHKERKYLEKQKAVVNSFKDVFFDTNVAHKDSVTWLLPSMTSYIHKSNRDAARELRDKIKAVETNSFMSVNKFEGPGLKMYNDNHKKSYSDTEQEISDLYDELDALYSPDPATEVLHNLRMEMNATKTQLVAPPSTLKLIAPLVFENDGKTFNLNFSSYFIDGKNWRKALDVPSGKNQITYFTQVLRLIEAEQKEHANYEMNGKIYDVKTLMENYRASISDSRIASFKSAVSMLKKGSDDNYTDDSMKLFYHKMANILAETGSRQMLLDMFRDEKFNKNTKVTVDKFIQLFLSHFSRGVLNQKATGHKYSLVSGFGHKVLYTIDEKTGNEVILNPIDKERMIKDGTFDASKYKKRDLRWSRPEFAKVLKFKDDSGNVIDYDILNDEMFTKGKPESFKQMVIDLKKDLILMDQTEFSEIGPVYKRVKAAVDSITPAIDRFVNRMDRDDLFKDKDGLSKNDKIIFGHPAIGKTFLRQSNNNIIDFDSDYKSRISKQLGIADDFRARQAWRKENPDVWKEMIRKQWKDAVAESKATGKTLVVSDMIILREFEDDLDRVITTSEETFLKRATQRGDSNHDANVSWKNNLDEAISKVNQNKVVSTDKYLSELDRFVNKKANPVQTPPRIVPKGKKVADGVYVNQEGLSKEEQLELFEYMKPFLEEQAAVTNKGRNANKMIGLGLRWDYRSNNPDKTPVHVGDSLAGRATSYTYYDKSNTGLELGAITPRFRELLGKATGIDITDYDAALINLYDVNTFIGNHNDIDESISAAHYPIAVANIGGEGNVIAGTNARKNTHKLSAGAGYSFGHNGENRKIYHSTKANAAKGFLPAITTKQDGVTHKAGSYRITITMRRVMPLTEGMPTAPAMTSDSASTAKPLAKTITENKERITEIYNNTPSLQEIGTVEDYLNFLNSELEKTSIKKLMFRGSDKSLYSERNSLLYFTDSANEASLYKDNLIMKSGFTMKRVSIGNIERSINAYLNKKYGKEIGNSIFINDDSYFDSPYPSWYDKDASNKVDEEDAALLDRLISYSGAVSNTNFKDEDDLINLATDSYTADSYKTRNELEAEFAKWDTAESNVKVAILKSNNPFTDDIVQEDLFNNYDAFSKGHDGALLMGGSHAVVKYNQVHELGFNSKDGFKEFVKNRPSASTPTKVKESAEQVYEKLGRKTANDRVTITTGTGKYGRMGERKAQKADAIFSMRVQGADNHFGNPFISATTPGGKATSKSKLDKIKSDFPDSEVVPTIKDAVIKYIDWVLNSTDDRAKFIRDSIASGELQGKDIHYYAELNQPSHATALDYLMNEYDWSEDSAPNNVNTTSEQLSLFDTPTKKKGKKVSPMKNRVFSIGDVTKQGLSECLTPRLYDVQFGQSSEEFEESAELRTQFASRIPSQTHASMMAFIVVGYLPTAMGDVIVAPKEIVPLSGADFDIDSLYAISKTFFSKRLKSTGKMYYNIHGKLSNKNINALELERLFEVAEKEMLEEAVKAITPEFMEKVRRLQTNYDDFNTMIFELENKSIEDSSNFSADDSVELTRLYALAAKIKEELDPLTERAMFNNGYKAILSRAKSMFEEEYKDFDYEQLRKEYEHAQYVEYMLKSDKRIKGEIKAEEQVYESDSKLEYDDKIKLEKTRIRISALSDTIRMYKDVDKRFNTLLKLGKDSTSRDYDTLLLEAFNIHLPKDHKIKNTLPLIGDDAIEADILVKYLNTFIRKTKGKVSNDFKKDIFKRVRPLSEASAFNKVPKSILITLSLNFLHAYTINPDNYNDALLKFMKQVEHYHNNVETQGIGVQDSAIAKYDNRIVQITTVKLQKELLDLETEEKEQTDRIKRYVFDNNDLMFTYNQNKKYANPAITHNETVDLNIALYSNHGMIEMDDELGMDRGATQQSALMIRVQGTKGKAVRDLEGIEHIYYNLGNLLMEMRGVPALSNYDALTATGRRTALDSNKGSAGLIGPTALAGIYNAVLSASKVDLYDNANIEWDEETFDTFSKESSRDVFFDKTVVDGKNVWHLAKKINGSHDTIKIRIPDDISTLLSVMTDAPKWNDPYKLQLNVSSLSTILYMISLGAGINRTMLLVQQAAVQEKLAIDDAKKHNIITKAQKKDKTNAKKALIGTGESYTTMGKYTSLESILRAMLMDTDQEVVRPLRETVYDFNLTDTSKYSEDEQGRYFKKHLRDQFDAEGKELPKPTVELKFNSDELFEGVKSRDLLIDVLGEAFDEEFQNISKEELIKGIFAEYGALKALASTGEQKARLIKLRQLYDYVLQQHNVFERYTKIDDHVRYTSYFTKILQVDKGLSPTFEDGVDKIENAIVGLGIKVAYIQKDDINGRFPPDKFDIVEVDDYATDGFIHVIAIKRYPAGKSPIPFDVYEAVEKHKSVQTNLVHFNIVYNELSPKLILIRSAAIRKMMKGIEDTMSKSIGRAKASKMRRADMSLVNFITNLMEQDGAKESLLYPSVNKINVLSESDDIVKYRSERIKGTMTFAEKAMRFIEKNPQVKTMSFIKSLIFSTPSETDSIHTVGIDSFSSKDISHENVIISEIASFANSDDSNYREFYQDFLDYLQVKDGKMMTKNSIIPYLPLVSFKEESNLIKSLFNHVGLEGPNDFRLKQIPELNGKTFAEIEREFKELYFRHPDNTATLPKVYGIGLRKSTKKSPVKVSNINAKALGTSLDMLNIDFSEGIDQNVIDELQFDVSKDNDQLVIAPEYIFYDEDGKGNAKVMKLVGFNTTNEIANDPDPLSEGILGTSFTYVEAPMLNINSSVFAIGIKKAINIMIANYDQKVYEQNYEVVSPGMSLDRAKEKVKTDVYNKIHGKNSITRRRLEESHKFAAKAIVVHTTMGPKGHVKKYLEDGKGAPSTPEDSEMIFRESMKRLSKISGLSQIKTYVHSTSEHALLALAAADITVTPLNAIPNFDITKHRKIFRQPALDTKLADTILESFDNATGNSYDGNVDTIAGIYHGITKATSVRMVISDSNTRNSDLFKYAIGFAKNSKMLVVIEENGVESFIDHNGDEIIASKLPMSADTFIFTDNRSNMKLAINGTIDSIIEKPQFKVETITPLDYDSGTLRAAIEEEADLMDLWQTFGEDELAGKTEDNTSAVIDALRVNKTSILRRPSKHDPDASKKGDRFIVRNRNIDVNYIDGNSVYSVGAHVIMELTDDLIRLSKVGEVIQSYNLGKYNPRLRGELAFINNLTPRQFINDTVASKNSDGYYAIDASKLGLKTPTRVDRSLENSGADLGLSVQAWYDANKKEYSREFPNDSSVTESNHRLMVDLMKIKFATYDVDTTSKNEVNLIDKINRNGGLTLLQKASYTFGDANSNFSSTNTARGWVLEALETAYVEYMVEKEGYYYDTISVDEISDTARLDRDSVNRKMKSFNNDLFYRVKYVADIARKRNDNSYRAFNVNEGSRSKKGDDVLEDIKRNINAERIKSLKDIKYSHVKDMVTHSSGGNITGKGKLVYEFHSSGKYQPAGRATAGKIIKRLNRDTDVLHFHIVKAKHKNESGENLYKLVNARTGMKNMYTSGGKKEIHYYTNAEVKAYFKELADNVSSFDTAMDSMLSSLTEQIVNDVVHPNFHRTYNTNGEINNVIRKGTYLKVKEKIGAATPNKLIFLQQMMAENIVINYAGRYNNQFMAEQRGTLNEAFAELAKTTDLNISLKPMNIIFNSNLITNLLNYEFGSEHRSDPNEYYLKMFANNIFKLNGKDISVKDLKNRLGTSSNEHLELINDALQTFSEDLFFDIQRMKYLYRRGGVDFVQHYLTKSPTYEASNFKSGLGTIKFSKSKAEYYKTVNKLYDNFYADVLAIKDLGNSRNNVMLDKYIEQIAINPITENKCN